jgi:hypothetical protein
MREVIALAQKQYGVISRKQLKDLGWSRAAIRQKLDKELFRLVLPGVYVLLGNPDTQQQRLSAINLSIEFPIWFSHFTAAELWGLKVSRSKSIEYTHSHGFKPPLRQGVKPHQSRLAEGVWKNGLPVTAVARTVVDLAEYLPARQLGNVIDEATQKRLVSLEKIEECYQRLDGRAGRKRMRSLSLRSPSESAPKKLKVSWSDAF